MDDPCEAAWKADTNKGGGMARFRNEPCRHNDADRGIYGGAGCGVHFHCMDCGGYWPEGVDNAREGRWRFSEWYAERKVAEALQNMKEHEAKHREKMRERDRRIRRDQENQMEKPGRDQVDIRLGFERGLEGYRDGDEYCIEVTNYDDNSVMRLRRDQVMALVSALTSWLNEDS